ncbi:N-acetyl-gamma-glutamyl-phosphate reductase [Corallococcus llansteffanensis]|uniref:N-acetyl-gamma-glutamyl-phosphate reductase n=1 Tax=Corallococcus llansteffanensis TaxID=2316731 RepID=A0A3A8PKZ3_9BACT|nr:N-acetyl-gamma-glutamyl-phosphate reductase [Corallococcus llansteffanensis]RKH55351.1 N-acetyl-gamma-glutamyl-phosphate reductase [Corallococcus llansteffanensis]
MTTPAHIYILGASGFGGGELLRLLSGHPGVAGIRVVSRHHAGSPIHKVHPHLRGLVEGRFEPEPDWRWLQDSPNPVVFSALGHGELAKQFSELEKQWAAAGLTERLLLVDLSSDFRLDHPGRYAGAYGRPHPAPELLGTFTYGLTEWKREQVKTAKRIANPGCFATAVQLALLPIAATPGLGLLAVSGVTGSSGSGSLPGEGTHHPTRAHDFRAYKPLEHQHEAEVEVMLVAHGASRHRLAFVPHSAPMVRGIFATVQFEWPEHGGAVVTQSLTEKYRRYYEGSKFVRIVEGTPRVAAVAGSNFCDISVATKGRSVAVMAALDNLVKGMAGQALQNFNVALGFPEDTGLRQAACYP